MALANTLSSNMITSLSRQLPIGSYDTAHANRLALSEAQLEGMVKTAQQVILPRKGVLELQRILGTDKNVELAIGTNRGARWTD